MKDPAGGAAPAGGFQNGGWYGGYQYFNGSFAPQAGVIHPESNQQGAGQAVSQEVNRQTSVAAGLPPTANQQFVNQQNQTVTPQPGGGGYPGGGMPSGGGDGGAGGGAGIGYTAPEVLNLPKLYQNLYDSSGISDLENDLSTKQKAYTDAQSKINDNPWLSEASRTGRQDKLTKDYNANVANEQNDVATKKADIQTQLAMQTKQFDINSQSAQQAMTQFGNLLQMGALDNASNEDIANITRSTGIPSGMIYSAIKANQAKNVKTQIIPFDDGQNQGFAVIDQNGNILNKQVVAGSKILGQAQDTAAYKTTGGGGSSKVTPADNKAQALVQLPEDFKNKMTLGTAMSFYQQFGLTPQQIYNQYKAVNYYKPTAAQQAADKKKYNVK